VSRALSFQPRKTVPSRAACSPRSNRRIRSTASLRPDSGRRWRKPAQSSTGGSPGPIPRTNRPSLNSCRLAARIAISTGLDENGLTMHVPTRIRWVAAATAVSTTHASRAAQSLAWWGTVFPGVAIAVLVIGANLLSDGLQRER
jgi:hypothetical protein